MADDEPKSMKELLNKLKNDSIEEQRLFEQMREVMAWAEDRGRLPRPSPPLFVRLEPVKALSRAPRPKKPINSDYERLYLRMYESGVLNRNAKLKQDQASLETLIEYLDK